MWQIAPGLYGRPLSGPRPPTEKTLLQHYENLTFAAKFDISKSAWNNLLEYISALK